MIVCQLVGLYQITMAMDWTNTEIDLIVADYFAMLNDELAGISFNKTERRMALMTIIPRSNGSIEYKHQNISAVMLGLGLPWINGYKPAPNFQGALVDGVLKWLENKPGWLSPNAERFASKATFDFDSFSIEPAPALRNTPLPLDPDCLAQIYRKVDVAERDARNRALGQAGERFIVTYEKARLRRQGQNALADKVRWTAMQDGDGYGYDIASFETDGRDRLIEVKTTNGWERTPFYLTRNELDVANTQRDHWHLLRVWNFAKQPKAFALRPPLEGHVSLTPTHYQAHIN